MEIDNTAEKLMYSAEKLFAAKGFIGVSIREIVKQAEVGNIGAVSYYYEGKKELYLSVLREHFKKIHLMAEKINQEENSPMEKLKVIFRAIRATYQQSPDTVKLLIREIHQPSEFFDDINEEIEKMQDIAQKIIRDGIKQGIFRQDLDVKTAALVLHSIAQFAYMMPNFAKKFDE